MKRSEMVNVIARAIIIKIITDIRDGRNRDEVDEREDAQEILNAIEASGMLPPYSGSDSISISALGDFGEDACTAEHVCGCNWEPENKECSHKFGHYDGDLYEHCEICGERGQLAVPRERT